MQPTNNNTVQPQFPKFNGKNNFEFWKIQLLFEYQDIWGVVWGFQSSMGKIILDFGRFNYYLSIKIFGE